MENELRSDVIIVGGGIGGLALASLLGREGVNVTVIDRAKLPRDRVCGEGIMPMGTGVLREIGIDPQSLPGCDFLGLDFATSRQRHSVGFQGARGRGVRRTHLVGALERTARSHPTVRFEEDLIYGPIEDGGAGETVTGVRGKASTYRAPFIAAADGVHSTMMHALGVARHERGERLGLRQHLTLPRPHGLNRVQVGLFAPYDVYLTPVGEREILATTMCDRQAYQEILGRYLPYLRSTPFGEQLAEAEPCSSLLGWFQPVYRPDRFVARGVPAVGDAGGGIDPCLGMGMSFALASADAAAEMALAILRDPAARPEAEASYEAFRRALFDHYSLFDRAFRALVTSGAGSELLVWGMRHWPKVAESFTNIVAQRLPWRGFPWPALLQPSRG